MQEIGGILPYLFRVTVEKLGKLPSGRFFGRLNCTINLTSGREKLAISRHFFGLLRWETYKQL
jgi:hypothetical protein